MKETVSEMREEASAQMLASIARGQRVLAHISGYPETVFYWTC